MSRGNGHANSGEPARWAGPLPQERQVEIRRGVGRLITGANELGVIAIVSPLFLGGLALAAEGMHNAGFLMQRGTRQRPLDFLLFGIYALALVALAIRARFGARRAIALLPDAIADDAARRAEARERILLIAGPAPVRHFADRVANAGCVLFLVFTAVCVALWLFLPTPDPLWLAIFAGTAVAMDVRWRALVADVAEQIPR